MYKGKPSKAQAREYWQKCEQLKEELTQLGFTWGSKLNSCYGEIDGKEIRISNHLNQTTQTTIGDCLGLKRPQTYFCRSKFNFPAKIKELRGW